MAAKSENVTQLHFSDHYSLRDTWLHSNISYAVFISAKYNQSINKRCCDQYTESLQYYSGFIQNQKGIKFWSILTWNM